MAKDITKRNPAMEAEMLKDIPKGRMGEPYEIAHAVMWLCSPYGTFVDGTAITTIFPIAIILRNSSKSTFGMI